MVWVGNTACGQSPDHAPAVARPSECGMVYIPRCPSDHCRLVADDYRGLMCRLLSVMGNLVPQSLNSIVSGNCRSSFKDISCTILTRVTFSAPSRNKSGISCGQKPILIPVGVFDRFAAFQKILFCKVGEFPSPSQQKMLTLLSSESLLRVPKPIVRFEPSPIRRSLVVYHDILPLCSCTTHAAHSGSHAMIQENQVIAVIVLVYATLGILLIFCLRRFIRPDWEIIDEESSYTSEETDASSGKSGINILPRPGGGINIQPPRAGFPGHNRPQVRQMPGGTINIRPPGRPGSGVNVVQTGGGINVRPARGDGGGINVRPAASGNGGAVNVRVDDGGHINIRRDPGKGGAVNIGR